MRKTPLLISSAAAPGREGAALLSPSPQQGKGVTKVGVQRDDPSTVFVTHVFGGALLVLDSLYLPSWSLGLSKEGSW